MPELRRAVRVFMNPSRKPGPAPDPCSCMVCSRAGDLPLAFGDPHGEKREWSGMTGSQRANPSRRVGRHGWGLTTPGEL